MPRAPNRRPGPRARRRGCSCLVLLALFGACDRGAAPGPSVALQRDDAALVGGAHVKEATVRRIAEAGGLPRERALDAAISDALLAEAARARLGAPSVAGAEASAAARALIADLGRAARAAGAPTEAELDGAIKARWWELDRPPMLRTTHAVARVSKPEDEARARGVAEKIREAVNGVSDVAEFKRRARAVDGGGIEVRVEDLDPVTADGRALDPETAHPPGFSGSGYDPDYVRGAFTVKEALAAGGNSRTSSVIHTQFGFHVILLTEEIPERRVGRDELMGELTPTVVSHRAKVLLDGVREAARAASPVEVDRAAIELMAKVEVVP